MADKVQASNHRLVRLEVTLDQLKVGLKACTPKNGHDRRDRDWYRSAIEQYEREIQWERKHSSLGGI